METSALPVSAPESNGSPVPAAEYAVPGPRARVLGPVELPAPPRPGAATLGALAAVAGIAAVALGALALVTGIGGARTADAALAADARSALGLLSKPSTQRIPLQGSGGSLVLAVGSGGRGVLVLRGLDRPPSGKVYEAWVAGPGESPAAPAALFTGDRKTVELTRPVPVGAEVAVTVEDAVGADVPSQRLRVLARRTG